MIQKIFEGELLAMSSLTFLDENILLGKLEAARFHKNCQAAFGHINGLNTPSGVN